MVVDYILGQAYEDVNLDQMPCIIPNCGHVTSMESMDGHMDLRAHYNLDGNDNPQSAIQGSSAPLSVDMRTCPVCRGSLRDINRYNRIVKRGLLDESTKKFINWSNSQIVPLATTLTAEEKSLGDTKEIYLAAKSNKKLAYNETTIALRGSCGSQIRLLRNLSGLEHRLGMLFDLRERISNFIKKVRKEEQPFARVDALAQAAAQVTGEVRISTFQHFWPHYLG